MTGRRFLKYINWSIAALLTLAVIGIWVVAWRPLPATSGRIEAPVRGEVTVRRDRLGVPHIEAATLTDAVIVQGLVTAQDRFWQMDAIRRVAAGELAEIVGADAIETDRESRALRLRRMVEEQTRLLPPADHALLAAYALGVNWYLETHRGRLPLEFTLLGYDPRPWTVADSLLVGLHMFRTLTTTWKTEILKADLIRNGDARKVNALFPTGSGAEVQPGSNAWVLAGAHTTAGRPILANDTHLEHSVPSTWYMAHLKAADVNVTGFTLPGLPMIIIGHNERIAWGVTNLHFDVQDLYTEKMDARTGRYRFRGAEEQARLEQESIAVRGARPLAFTQWVTRHGPVVAGDQDRRHALKWVAAEPGEFRFPFVDLNRAGNWGEFRAALKNFAGPAQNYVYADVDGNIGYQAAGRLPRRTKAFGDVPVDGGSGEFEWDGVVPFERLPSSFNPPSGVLVTANQNPFPSETEYAVGGNFAPHYRARQIRARLESRRQWKAEEMLAVQADIYSHVLRYLAGELAAAWSRRGVAHPSRGAAVDLIRRWDGQMRADAAAPMIATLLYQHLRKAVAERAAPGKGLAYEQQMAPVVVEELVRGRPKDWFADYDRLLLEAFADAMEEGQRLQGRDPTRWRYGRMNVLHLAHPVLSRLPVVGRYFTLGTVAQDGSPTTVNQVTRRLGPSMRMVVDLADWDRSLANLSIGQSGHVLSRHYRDQFDAHLAGRSFPMQFRRVDAVDTLVVVPVRP